MKRKINFTTAMLLAFGASSAFAINGDLLMGIGAKSRSMGGLGIAKSFGGESGLLNPAMLSQLQGSEVSAAMTFFHPVAYYNGGAGEEYSSSDLTLIPELSYAQQVDEHFYWGAGMWVVGGLGADYSESGNAVSGGNATFQMRTILGLVKFGLPLTYKDGALSIGFTPIMQYGELDINYLMPDGSGGVNNIADGSSKDIGFGYNFGLSYDLSNQGVKDLTVGLVYKSSIKMEYKGQISAATQPFAAALGGAMSDKLEQPAEMGVGVSYKFLEHHTFAFDYKYIDWESAQGYKDFGWKNQNVYMLGYEYKEDMWALRLGYNYAKSPLREQDGTTRKGATLNLLNLLGFPVNIESHYTLGASYSFTQKISADLAFVYADQQSNTYNTSALVSQGMAPAVFVRHKQLSTTLQLNYNY